MRRLKHIYSFLISSALLLLISFALDKLVVRSMVDIKNAVFDYVLAWASWELTVVIFFFVMTSLFLWEEKKRGYIQPLWLSFALALMISIALKLLFMRERPFITEVTSFLGMVSYAFPSSHAAVCFAALPILDREFSKLKWFWLGFALLVVISRLYFGLHYISDVVAGMILGYGVGYIVLHTKLRHRG